MKTENNLKETYKEFKIEIEPIIKNFNKRKGDFNELKIKKRIGFSKFEISRPNLEKNWPFLGIADIGEQMQDSDFYKLLIEYVKSKGYIPNRTTYLMGLNDNNKMEWGKEYWDKDDFPHKIFPLTSHKEEGLSVEPTFIYLLQITKDLKLELLGFRDIIEPIL